MRILLLAALLSLAASDEVGLSGSVLKPDGTPVPGGRVILARSLANRSTATIDRTGHFKMALEAEGPFQLWVVMPGLAPYRMNLIVPPTHTIKLPPIHLSPATYFRARFVTADGETIMSPTIRRRTVDAIGAAWTVPDEPAGDQIDTDGTVTIGPLQRGITSMAVDVPPLARLRLDDVVVPVKKGKEDVIDAGAIVVPRGAVLLADIVDESGAPVPAHDVSLEDSAPRSPLSFDGAKTNAQGRVTFERLGPGRYRVSTLTKDRCGNRPLLISKIVPVGSGAEVHTRIVIGGTAHFRFVSPLGPVKAGTVTASPDSGSTAPSGPSYVSVITPSGQRLQMSFSAGGCSATTDAEGRVSFNIMPPGSANVTLRLLNSTYVKRLPVPEGGREVEFSIPDGLVTVLVADQRTNRPIASAKVAWTGSEGRVEATTNGNGAALIEAAGANGGRLAISAEGYETLEANFTELPPAPQEVMLPPLPSKRAQLAIVNDSNTAVANAVIEFVPSDPIDISSVMVTDAKGIVTFMDMPRGPLRFLVTAEGYTPAEVRVDEDARSSTVVALKRVIP